MSTVRIKGDTSGYVDLAASSAGGNLSITNGTNTPLYVDNTNNRVGINTTNTPSDMKLVVEGNSNNIRIRNINTRYRSDWYINSSGAAELNCYDDTSASYMPLTLGGSHVAKPFQPMISGQMGSALTSPSGAQVLKFDDIWVSRGITYNSGTGRFTVPVGGQYRITMNPFKHTSSGATRVYIGINTDNPLGNTHYGQTYCNSSGSYVTMSLNSIVTLAANDYIVFKLFEGQLYNLTTDRFNQFSIELIG